MGDITRVKVYKCGVDLKSAFAKKIEDLTNDILVGGKRDDEILSGVQVIAGGEINSFLLIGTYAKKSNPQRKLTNDKTVVVESGVRQKKNGGAKK